MADTLSFKYQLSKATLMRLDHENQYTALLWRYVEYRSPLLQLLSKQQRFTLMFNYHSIIDYISSEGLSQAQKAISSTFSLIIL